ncbi:MAG: hypothetical protein H6636_06255 [Anaerolineales bacterium]|nr:hypothetical protein [Anaerolineales bacterium]
MAKNTPQQQKKKSGTSKSHPSKNEGWLPTRTGLVAVAVVSIFLAVMVTFQATKVSGFGESLLYGLGFGGSIWLIFGLVFFVNKILRKR